VAKVYIFNSQEYYVVHLGKTPFIATRLSVATHGCPRPRHASAACSLGLVSLTQCVRVPGRRWHRWAQFREDGFRRSSPTLARLGTIILKEDSSGGTAVLRKFSHRQRFFVCFSGQFSFRYLGAPTSTLYAGGAPLDPDCWSSRATSCLRVDI